VWSNRIILKTCGTTTLLNCITKLLEIAALHGLPEVEDVFYCRKSFLFPEKQLFPHSSFKDECTFLDQYFRGSGYVMGKLNGDRWYLYVTDNNPSASTTTTPDQTLEILMTDVDREAMRHFYKTNPKNAGKTPQQITEASGIKGLFPTAIIDEFLFEPCGYSLNALEGDTYYTIHITPQPNCSYVSFETNVTKGDYTAYIQQVLDVFKPKNFTVTLFANMFTAPSVKSSFPAAFGVCKKTATIKCEFENNYKLMFTHYSSADARVSSCDGSAIKKPRTLMCCHSSCTGSESPELSPSDKPSCPCHENL